VPNEHLKLQGSLLQQCNLSKESLKGYFIQGGNWKRKEKRNKKKLSCLNLSIVINLLK